MNRGLRNNNPLNIRHSADRWQGARPEQTDPAFVQFVDDAYGYRAAWKVLNTYARHFRKEGKPFCINTIIARWAPPAENDTDAYVRIVLRLCTCGGNELLLPPTKVKGYLKLAEIIGAMTCVECGIDPAQVDTEAICQGYRLAFPENAARLDRLLKGLDEYSDWG